MYWMNSFRRNSHYIAYLLGWLFVGLLWYSLIFSWSNISWMLHGDWYTHAIIADQIFVEWNMLTWLPYQKFDSTRYAPIHYTQVYHLLLWSYNTITWVWTFWKYLSVFFLFFIYTFWFLIVRRLDFSWKRSWLYALISCVLIFVLGERIFKPSYIEPFLLLNFLFFIFSVLLYSKDRTSLLRLLMIPVSLGLVTISKHMWMFIWIVLFWIFFVYSIFTKKSYRDLFLVLMTYLLCVLWPLWLQLNNVWSLWYWTWKTNIPDSIPYDTNIEKIFFQSNFKQSYTEEELVKLSSNRLSYVKKRAVNEYVTRLSNYIIYFDRPSEYINFIFLLFMWIWMWRLFRKERELSIYVLTAVVLSLTILIVRSQRIFQYQVILIYIIGLLLFLWLLNTRKGLRQYIVVVFLFLMSYINFHKYLYANIYDNVWRKTHTYETLYRDLWEYIHENNLTEGPYLNSNLMFSHATKVDYVRWKKFFIWVEEFKKYTSRDDVRYLVLTGFNNKGKWLYDSVSTKLINTLMNEWYIDIIRKKSDGDDEIVLYKIISS